MGRAYQLDLKPLRWGFVVLQDKHDWEECRALIAAAGGERVVGSYEAAYKEMHLSGGFCHVPNHPVPWLICLFTTDERKLNSLFGHEAVHLAEMLLVNESVPLSSGTGEVRAQIVQRAIELFEEVRSGIISEPKRYEFRPVTEAPAPKSSDAAAEPAPGEKKPPENLAEDDLLVFGEKHVDDWYWWNMWTPVKTHDTNEIQHYLFHVWFLFTRKVEGVEGKWVYLGTFKELAERYKWSHRPEIFPNLVREEGGRHLHYAMFRSARFPKSLARADIPKIIVQDEQFETVVKSVDKTDFTGKLERFAAWVTVLLIVGAPALFILVAAVPGKTMWQGGEGPLIAFLCALVGIPSLVAGLVYFSQHDFFLMFDAMSRSVKEVAPIDKFVPTRFIVMYIVLAVGVSATALLLALIWQPILWIVGAITAARMVYVYSQRPEPKVEVPVEPPKPPPPPLPGPETLVEKIVEERLRKK